MFQRILFASDGSDHALRAGVVAGELAKRYGSGLTVVQVFAPQPSAAPLPEGTGFVFDAADTVAVMEAVQDTVSHRTGRILDEAGVAYDIRQEIGQPADSIVRVAEEVNADLIVVGSRGHNVVQSFFLGSVSDRVVHHAHCPVLIVK